jgi:hypothetical protein
VSTGGVDVRGDRTKLIKLRKELSVAQYGVTLFPVRMPNFVRGAMSESVGRQYGILQLAKQGKLPPHILAAVPSLEEELRALGSKLGEPIHLERDTGPLSAGSIDQVGSIVSRVCGFAALFFGLAPCMRLWRNGALLAQYFAFMESRGAAVRTQLLFCRHSVRLIKEERSKSACNAEESAIKLVLDQVPSSPSPRKLN